ncbi:MAG: hypothetical protein ACOYNY_01760 [Caldilineaceae bacterium]
MSRQDSPIPLWIKIIAWIFVPVGIFFTYAYYTNPTLIFPTATLDTPVLQFSFYSTGARALAMLMTLVLALLWNRPEPLALVFTMRILTEVQDLFISLNTKSDSTGEAIFIGVVVAIQIICLVTLVRRMITLPKTMA